MQAARAGPAARAGIAARAGRAARAACALAVAGLLAACSGGEPAPGARAQPDVVVIVVDTLRADHLGCYGYELDTSPVLDALAATAHLFAANTSQCNATFPSITSIFTGFYPRTHRNYHPVPLPGQAAHVRQAATLAERLGEHGYTCLAVGSHPAWYEPPADTAIGRGWDAFSVIPPELDARARRHEEGRADRTNARAFALLEHHLAERPDAPLLLWLHYFDPHTTYDPPEAYRDLYLAHHLQRVGQARMEPVLAGLDPEERSRWIFGIPDEEAAMAVNLGNGRALYDGEIRHTDAQIGRLLERLDALGRLRDAIVVVMADHGENMDDLAWGHGRINFTHKRLFDGVVRTPLVIRLPGQREGRRHDALTQNVDVLPTLLELLGLPCDPPVEGRSLVPLLRGGRDAVHERVFTESSDQVELALRTDEYKLVEPGTGADPLLFRWRADPFEQRELSAEAPDGLVAALRGELAAFRPRRTLRLRFTPGARPARLTVELELVEARIEGVLVHGGDGAARGAGDAAGTLAAPADPARFVHTAVVAGEVLDLRLFLDRPSLAGVLTLRSDGPWTSPGAVALGGVPLLASGAGHGEDAGRLSITLPGDGAALAALGGDGSAEQPPGTLHVWLDAATHDREIDPATLDPELLEELRALGYVR